MMNPIVKSVVGQAATARSTAGRARVQVVCGIFLMLCGVPFPSPGVGAEPTHPNVAYGSVDGNDLLLDIYQPETDVDRKPLIVWVHGGAWRRGSKESVPVIGWLDNGFAIASVDYRLSPVAQFPAQIHDIKAAIRFLRANATRYEVDPERFVVAGSSAGGHLAALVGVTNSVARLEGDVGMNDPVSSDVQAAVSFYGASNLESILSQSTPHGLGVRVPALKLLLGDLPKRRPQLAKLASPVHHVDASDPPLWLIHGDADPQMPIEQSKELVQRYEAKNLTVDFDIIAGGQHGGEEFYSEERLDRLANELKKALASQQ